jgi:hypothetical protein
MSQVFGPQVGLGIIPETIWWLNAEACAWVEWLGANPAISPATARERMEARTKSFIVVNLIVT